MLTVTSGDVLLIECSYCKKQNSIPVQDIIDAGFREEFECEDCCFPLFVVTLSEDYND